MSLLPLLVPLLEGAAEGAAEEVIVLAEEAIESGVLPSVGQIIQKITQVVGHGLIVREVEQAAEHVYNYIHNQYESWSSNSSETTESTTDNMDLSHEVKTDMDAPKGAPILSGTKRERTGGPEGPTDVDT